MEQLWHCVTLCQALNNLAVTDEIKAKIVEAGALPHYVKLLSHERNEDVQIAAAHGLFILATTYKDSNLEETGYLDG